MIYRISLAGGDVTFDHDDLYSDDGNDTLIGQGGRDTILGGAGSDLIMGGNGSDHSLAVQTRTGYMR